LGPGPWSGQVRSFLLFHVQLDAFALNVETKPDEEAHVDIGYPDERQPPKQQPRPPVHEHSKPGERNRHSRDVMAEAVLAGEHVEELPGDQASTLTTLPDTPRV
jgi:hypothetical protein